MMQYRDDHSTPRASYDGWYNALPNSTREGYETRKVWDRRDGHMLGGQYLEKLYTHAGLQRVEAWECCRRRDEFEDGDAGRGQAAGAVAGHPGRAPTRRCGCATTGAAGAPQPTVPGGLHSPGPSQLWA